MKILGIDPGYGRCGVCVIDNSTKPETVLFSDCIETAKNQDLSKRLKVISDEVRRVIKEYKPKSIALERLFFDRNKTTAIDVAQLRGALILIAAENNLSLFEYTPAQIKVATTGYGRATKNDVIKMIPKLVKFDKSKALDDEYDAIAIALTCSASEKF